MVVVIQKIFSSLPGDMIHFDEYFSRLKAPTSHLFQRSFPCGGENVDSGGLVGSTSSSLPFFVPGFDGIKGCPVWKVGIKG